MALPKRIYYYITTKCNVSCSYCYNENVGINDELDFDHIFQFLEYIQNKNVELVITGGEPTLHTKFFDLLNCLLKLKIKFIVDTNGIYSKNTIMRLKQYKGIRMKISPKSWEIDDGIHTYKETINNIMILKDNGGFDLSAQIIVTKKNHNIIREINNDLKILGIHNIKYHPAFLMPEKNKLGSDQIYGENIEDTGFLDICKELSPEYFIDPVCMAGTDCFNLEYENKNNNYSLCACSFYRPSRKKLVAGFVKYDDLESIERIWMDDQCWKDFRDDQKGVCIFHKGNTDINT